MLRSRQVLECDAEVLMVGVPGLALPDSALATAMLPSVPDMVDASIANSYLARKMARPPPPEPTPHPAPGKPLPKPKLLDLIPTAVSQLLTSMQLI